MNKTGSIYSYAPWFAHMLPAARPLGASELPRVYQTQNPLGRVSIFYQNPIDALVRLA